MSRPFSLTVVAGIVAFTLALGGCSIYRMDIAQGNIVTQEMVDQLRPGMTRSQVRFIMGPPLVADSFHADRWDYYYSLKRGTESKPLTHLVTVNFKNDQFVSIEGDTINATGATSTVTPEPAASKTNP